MIWQPEGGNKWYIIEREAATKEGVRKAVFRAENPWAVAEFRFREDAEAELLKWPSRAEEEAAQTTASGSGAGAEAGAEAGAQAGSGHEAAAGAGVEAGA